MGLFFRNNASDYCKYKRSIDIKRIHASYNNDLLNTNTSIAIVDTHEGKPFYDKRKDIIYLDMHFFDYSRIVGAALLTGNISVMRTLGYACAADYYLCKDTIYLALHYAKMFAKEKEDIAFLLNTTEQGAYDAFFRELLFIIGHEQGHALLAYNREDRRFSSFRKYFRQEIESQNSITEQILSINLDPIKDDLDNYNAHLDDINSFTDSDLKTIIERANRFGQIVNKGMRLIEFPEDALMDPLDLLYYACDHYIKQGNQDILDPSRYEEDSIVDGLSLYRLASVRFDERNTTSSLIDTVETYYTCMLTMNIIMCVNTCVMNYRSEAYKEQDYVWNRLRLEREIFNKVIQSKAAKEWNYLAVEKSVFAVARRLVKRYERLYAVFCDTVYALDHPDENTPDYFYGTEEYKKMYQEIQALLKISY